MSSLTFRSLLLTGTISALTVPAAHALDVKLYGTVNKSLMVYDDGQSTETTVVDNNNESTRVGLAGEQKLDNGLTASVLLEMDHTSNASNLITQNTTAGQSATPANTGAGLTERVARVGLSGEHGALFLGQQDVATDDAFVHDLGAATSVLNGNVAAFGGGLTFRTNTGAVVSAGGTDLTPTLFALGNDGTLAAADSVRFNSATYNGLNGSASISQGGNADLNVRYANTFGDFQFDSALGHTFTNSNAATGADEVVGTTLGSASIKHSSGLAGTVAYITNHIDDKSAGVENAQGYYAKASYAWDAFGVAAEYGKFSDPVATSVNQEMDVYGVGAEYNLGNGVTTGALYRNFSADVDGVSSIEDINVFTVGMRVKF